MRNKHHRKICNNDPTKNCVDLKSKLLEAAYNYKVERFKMDEDPLQLWFYFLTFVHSLKIGSSQCNKTCMLLT